MQTLSRADQGTRHQTGLAKKTEIIPNIFSDHSGMKLEMKKSEARKCTNIWKLNMTVWNSQGVKERNQKKTAEHVQTNGNGGKNPTQTCGLLQKQF